jgi:hypothetical protein
MYNDLGGSWTGLTRALYGVSSLSYIGLSLLLIIGCLALLAPFYWLIRLLFSTGIPPLWGPLAIIQVALLFIMRRWVDARFKEGWLATLLYPLGIIFLIAVVINGMGRRLVGASVSWKKRSYDEDSQPV